MKLKNLLIQFIREHIWSYLFGLVILICANVIAMMIPKIIGIITDALVNQNTTSNDIVRWIMIMLVVVVAAFIFKFGWRYLLIGNSRSVECFLRDHLFAHLQRLSSTYYNNHKTGELIAYAINDIQAIRSIFGPGVLQAVNGVTISVLSFVFMAGTINLYMTLLMALPIPPVLFLMMWLSKIIQKRHYTVQKSYAEISDKVQENLSGIRVIKAFSQEEEEIDNFAVFNKARLDAQLHLNKVSAIVNPLVQCCFGVGFFFFIILGSSLVKSGTISIGDFIAFNLYTLIILGPVTHVTNVIDFWQKGIASAKRLQDIFSIKHEFTSTSDVVDRPIKGSIEVKNLSFSYPGTNQEVLSNLSISIDAGKTLGILGRTGSGKSTLANLLLRLYPVHDGEILIDGVDINSTPADYIRENVGYVPQDNFLFSTTIKNNIEFFRKLYTDEEIENAARQSEVYDTVASFTNGFDTMIGERGVTLSGGQKQRVSIARALVKNPSIIILDDSLSAVDALTEQKILKNIRKVLKNRTGIIISHRVASVKSADEIIILDNGKIIEQGNHTELIHKKGEYWRLWISQRNKTTATQSDEHSSAPVNNSDQSNLNSGKITDK